MEPVCKIAAPSDLSNPMQAPESKKRKIEDEALPAEPAAAAASSVPALPLVRAQWWWYMDGSDKKQGPQYPGPMRDWFAQGYFTAAATKVAPSFMGEVWVGWYWRASHTTYLRLGVWCIRRSPELRPLSPLASSSASPSQKRPLPQARASLCTLPRACPRSFTTRCVSLVLESFLGLTFDAARC